jgi:uncharacterized membrane protein YbhN (UPF0104 family)
VLRVGSIILGLAAGAYFLTFVYRTLRVYDFHPTFSAPVLTAMAGAALAYALIVPVTAWAWRRLLRDAGVESSFLHLNMIVGLTQIAKYLPGSIGQQVGRSTMAIQRGIRPGPVFITLATELALAVAAAIVVGLGALMVPLKDHMIMSPPRPTIFTIVALGAFIAIAGCLASRALGIVGRRLADFSGHAASLALPRARVMRAAFGAYALNYILIGAGLFAIASSVSDVHVATLPFFVGSFAISWVAGFLVPGAPAGLGVREGVLIGLLHPVLDGVSALNVVLVFRIATTIGDLLGFLWGCGLYLTSVAVANENHHDA